MRGRPRETFSVIVTGGGTGGHVSRAIAVATLLKREPGVERLLYVGAPFILDKMNAAVDGEAAARAGIDFYPIRTRRMPRQLGLDLGRWSFELGAAVIEANRLLGRFRPDVIFSTGSFPAGPVLIAAALRGVPFLFHDANVLPGVVHRAMAPFAHTAFTGFEAARHHLWARRIVHVGHPLRREFLGRTHAEALAALGLDPGRRVLLAFGASRGAASINSAMLGASRPLIERHGMQIIHQTGRAQHQTYLAALKRAWPEHEGCGALRVVPYLDDPSLAMAASDLALTMAGAVSAAELCAYGVPTIMAPEAIADEDHQSFNARELERRGASIVVLERELSSARLLSTVEALLADPSRLATMSRAARAFFRPDADRQMVAVIKEVGLGLR